MCLSRNPNLQHIRALVHLQNQYESNSIILPNQKKQSNDINRTKQQVEQHV